MSAPIRTIAMFDVKQLTREDYESVLDALDAREPLPSYRPLKTVSVELNWPWPLPYPSEDICLTDLEIAILGIVQRHPHTTTNGIIRRIPARRETVRYVLTVLKKRGVLTMTACFDPITKTTTKHWRAAM